MAKYDWKKLLNAKQPEIEPRRLAPGMGHNMPPEVIQDHSPATPRSFGVSDGEGMSVEEQRAWDAANPGKQTPPYPPGRSRDWTSLLDSRSPAASPPSR